MNNLQWIWKYVIPIRWGYLLGLIFLLIEVGANVLTIGIQKVFIDSVFMNERYDLLWITSAVFVGSIISLHLFRTLSAHTLRVNSYHVHRALAKDMMHIIHRLPGFILQNERTAKFVQYFTSDLGGVSHIFSRYIPRGLSNMLTCIVIAIVIGIANPLLLIAVTVFSLIYFWLGKYFGPMLRKASKDVQEKKSDLLVHIEEGISSTREIVAFHRNRWEMRKFNILFDTYYTKIMDEIRVINKKLLCSDPLKWASHLIVLGVGGYQVIQGSISIGLFVVIYQLTSQLMFAIHGTYEFFMELQGKMANLDRIKTFMDSESNDEGSLPLTEQIHSIEFIDVSFKYIEETDHVLDRFSLSIPIGKKVAFVGNSGGGKSTITQLLMRLHKSSAGEITINGKSLSEIKRSDWMSKVAIVAQEPYLFPDSIRNNLLMGRTHISEEEMIQMCKKAHIDTYIQSLPHGYDTVLGERGVNLSGGQKQRVAIARALLSDAELLILDEATSALDLHTERLLIENLDKYRSGKTTIIIAHRLSTIQNADLICVMEEGKVKEKGLHEHLMLGDTIYQRLTKTI